MEPPQQPDLTAALDRLWQQFLPQIKERLAALQSASAAVTAGSISREGRESAASAAHKLAGVLGTFGLREGTQLARELEVAYSSETSPALAPQITECTDALHRMIEDRH